MKPSLSSIGIVFTAGLVLADSGCSRPTAAATSRGAQSLAAAAVDRVTAARLERKNLLLHTSQPGRIEAFEEAPLYPKVTGYVQEVSHDIGDVVERGQILVKLWIPEMQDERKQKEALVAQAAAEVEQAKAAIQVAQAAVGTAGARVKLAEAGVGRVDGEYERWKAERERIDQLAADRSVTQKLAHETLSQFRAAEAARLEAAANVEAAAAALLEARANVHQTNADHMAAEARHEVAKANLAHTETMLGYAEIKAPFDGVVTRRLVDTGHYVHPASGGSTKPLLVVARTDKVRVFVDVPEMEASATDGGDHGDSALVRVQALGDKQFDAKVTRTSWSLNPANRSLRAQIDLPNAEGLLRPGMYAMATILLDQRNDALAVPITAIVREGQDAYCCCVDAGKIDRRRIALGLRSGSEVEIASGLESGQMVVMAQADSLQQGQRVEVIAPDN